MKRPGTFNLRPMLALSLLIAACGSGGGSTAAPSNAPLPAPSSAAAPSSATTGEGRPASVIVEKFRFTPAELHVPAGSSVVWTNRELSLHTVTAGTPGHPSGQFDSGTFDTGQTFVFTFPAAGQYPYFCSRHQSMVGMVVVGP